jgi:hypothetical protein
MVKIGDNIVSSPENLFDLGGNYSQKKSMIDFSDYVDKHLFLG